MLPRSCVCVLTVGLPDPSRQTARPDAGDGWSGGIVLASGQNRPERNSAERPGRDVLARRANRGPGCDAAVRPHGRMRDGPKGRSPLRHAQPSWGGRKALAKVDVRATPLPTIGIACPGIRLKGRADVRCGSEKSEAGQENRTFAVRFRTDLMRPQPFSTPWHANPALSKSSVKFGSARRNTRLRFYEKQVVAWHAEN